MDDDRFDDLTRSLATGVSRRQALKLLGGSLLAALVPGSVLAKGGDNSACAKFCNTVFGADTPAANQCISDAAHGTGLCSTCSSADPSSVCCVRDSSGYCSSDGPATCCSSGQSCQDGQCVTLGIPYHCTCRDGTTQSTCSSSTCYSGNIIAICSGLCKDHDGFTYIGSCEYNNPCTV